PGSPDQHAVISNLYFSIGYSGTPPDSPNPDSGNGKMNLYNWALAAFAWSAVENTVADLKTEVKTGRSLPNGAAEVGTVPHPDWRAQIPAGGGVEIWDIRPYGF